MSERARHGLSEAPVWLESLGRLFAKRTPRPKVARLMHDGATVTLSDAILRHRREAGRAARRFERLSKADREALLEFLRSL